MGDLINLILSCAPAVVITSSSLLSIAFLLSESRLRGRARIAMIGICGVGQVLGFALILVQTMVSLQSGDRSANAATLIMAVGVLGFSFWCFRLKQRAAYGMLEIAFGASAAAALAWTPSDSPITSAVGLAASVYVVVRGLDNVDQGLKGGLWARLPLRWADRKHSDDQAAVE